MAPNISSKSRLNRENQIKRQIEAAKRLRLIAQLLGEDSYSRLYRAADLISSEKSRGIPQEDEFRLVLLVDLILNDQHIDSSTS
jgi:hypothetical protein